MTDHAVTSPMAISTAPDSSLSWYESVVPETPSRIRYAPVRRQMNERTTPEFPSIPPRFQPVVRFETEYDRFATTKEYSVFLIFLAQVRWAGNNRLATKNGPAEALFSRRQGDPLACALVGRCLCGFLTLFVGGAQRFNEQHAIDIAKTVEHAVHPASELLVRNGLIVDLGWKSSFA